MERRRFLKAIGSGLIISPLLKCSNLVKSKRPNILILFTDDQRFSAVNALGNPEVQTPNMDRLVRSGVSFTNTYIMGSIHAAVCAPSRAMLMTGRYLFHLPESILQTWAVPPEERGRCPYISLPEVFKAAGYRTFGTGKQHNGRKFFAKGFTDGAKIFFGGMSNHLKVPVCDFDPNGDYPDEAQYMGEKFSSELFADAAIRFLNNQNGGQPFLMYVSFTAPHDPRMAPKEYADMYPADKITIPENFMPKHPFDNGELEIRDEKLAPFPRTPEVVQEHLGAYYAMITHLDAQIGRILQTLEKKGLGENTIVVFAGDNGLAVGQHGLFGKQNLYEHSVCVPLVFCGPGIPRGRKREALAYLSDVYPTICDLAGIETPDSVETKSLAPVIMKQRDTVRDAVFFAYNCNTKNDENGKEIARGFQRGVRSNHWKLIKYLFKGDTRTQLFNLQDDPWELNNLADNPDHAGSVKDLTDILKKWMKTAGDPLDLDKPGWDYKPGEDFYEKMER